jgi:chemotaxis protein CheX
MRPQLLQKSESGPLDAAITPVPEDDNASISPSRPDGPHSLPQTLDLTQAHGLQQSLMALLGGGGAVVLDASAVERMSTPCMQVLLAAGLAAQAANSQLQIVNASDVFLAAVADLGLQPQFTKWMI